MLNNKYADSYDVYPIRQAPSGLSNDPRNQSVDPMNPFGYQMTPGDYFQSLQSSNYGRPGQLGFQQIPSGLAQSLVQESPSNYLAYTDQLNQPPPGQSDYRISGSQLEGDLPQGLSEGGYYYEADDGYIYWKRHGNEGR